DVCKRDALPGRDVELERVPRAGHDLTLPDPGELPIGMGPVVDRARHVPFTERTALVRAEVRQRMERAADVEHAELAPPDPDDAMLALREILDRADRMLAGHVRRERR